MLKIRDVKRLSVYRLSFIFLVLVFEFQKPIIVSNLAISSRLKDASRSAVARQSAALCHSLTRHVGLRNLIQQQDERACGRGVPCVPCHFIAGQITDMGVAGTWLTSQVAYDSCGGGVGRGRTAPRRTLLWPMSDVTIQANKFRSSDVRFRCLAVRSCFSRARWARANVEGRRQLTVS